MGTSICVATIYYKLYAVEEIKANILSIEMVKGSATLSIRNQFIQIHRFL